MRKTTFIANFVAWVVLAVACTAFLAWYHLSGTVAVAEVLDMAIVQVGIVAAAPVLLYAIGVVLGLLLVRFRGITFRPGAKRALRAVGLVGLALIVLGVLPYFVQGLQGALMWASAIVVVASMTAPLLLSAFGFAYALGCAGVSAPRPARS